MNETDNKSGDAEEQARPPRYAPTSPYKFVLLYLATSGLYGLVWLYRNWRYVKARDESPIWPLARTIFFTPVWYYLLIRDIHEHEGAGPPGWLAAAYFLSFINALPDPYGLVAWYAGGFALLPTVLFINRVNAEAETEPPVWFGWRLRNGFYAVAGVLVATVMMGGLYGPSTGVVDGANIGARHVSVLQELELLRSEDEVLYFYSPGFFSVRDEGAILTADHLVVYWTDWGTDERVVVRVRHDEIADVQPKWSGSAWEDTVVAVELWDGRRFSFVLSSESDGDEMFVTELERLRRGGPVEALPAV